MKIYGSEPIEIASDVIVDNSEMYFYQYLPIRFPDMEKYELALPTQLEKLRDLVHKCLDDFQDVKENLWEDYYVYLTAKCLYVKAGENLNREGWHCDGFMSDDINYIWCDCIPAEYVTGEFELIQDHEKSIDQIDRLLYYFETTKFKSNSIYRLDETVIHRSDYNRLENAVLRHFVKVSFSKEKYNLKGNSRNYLLDYNWEMKERGSKRNHPVK